MDAFLAAKLSDMKICLYQSDVQNVFQNCLTSLKDSGFEIENTDSKNGLISSSKEGTNTSNLSLIDLKLKKEKYAIVITIISSNLSKIFGCFYHNPEDELSFIESLFRQLNVSSNEKLIQL